MLYRPSDKNYTLYSQGGPPSEYRVTTWSVTKANFWTMLLTNK